MGKVSHFGQLGQPQCVKMNTAIENLNHYRIIFVVQPPPPRLHLPRPRPPRPPLPAPPRLGSRFRLGGRRGVSHSGPSLPPLPVSSAVNERYTRAND